MIGMLLDDNSVRLQMGNAMFAVSNEAGEELSKQNSKRLKARRGAFTQELEETIETMKKQRVLLKAKFKDKIGLPEIEPNENADED